MGVEKSKYVTIKYQNETNKDFDFKNDKLADCNFVF